MRARTTCARARKDYAFVWIRAEHLRQPSHCEGAAGGGEENEQSGT